MSRQWIESIEEAVDNQLQADETIDELDAWEQVADMAQANIATIEAERAEADRLENPPKEPEDLMIQVMMMADALVWDLSNLKGSILRTNFNSVMAPS